MSEMPATHHAADRQTQLCSETDHQEDDEGNQSCGANRPSAGRLDGTPAGPTGGSVTPTPPTAAESPIKSNQIKMSQICSHKNKTGFQCWQKFTNSCEVVSKSRDEVDYW